MADAGTITRETFWQIGAVGEVVFYYLAAVALLVFFYGIYQRISVYARADPDPFERLDDLPGRTVRATRDVLTNARQFDRDVYAGVMHALIVWGFLTLLVGTTILGIDMDLYRPLTGQSFFVGDFYLSYSFVMDAMGLLFVVGVGMALYRRYWVHNERLWGEHTAAEDHLFVWTLFVLGVGGYVTEGLRILGTATNTAQGVAFTEYEQVSFVGWFVADLLHALGVSPAAATAAYPVAWWSHALIALGFVAFVPYAKPMHMLTSFANTITRDEKAGVRLPRVPEDASPDEIGYASAEDFSWRDMLDHDACTKCGRCSSVCPAKAAGRPLDPRDVILDLKGYRESVADGGGDVPVIADGGTSVIDPETMASCMSCMACMDACPVDIEHVKQFTGMNRRLVESGGMDDTVGEAMMNAFRTGNTFGDSARKRPKWTEELPFEIPDAREEDVEFLWYVGDYPSYDDRNQRVARALATIFHQSGISYGILYEDEQTDGNDVRRVGEEGLFEQLVEDNTQAFAEAEFDKIVCTDPHSYNTFENEYPEMAEAFEYPVYHYTQLVETIVGEGWLDLHEVDRTVTYHDPCHLGRFNGEYEAPRELVRATGADLYEMPRSREDSFCCGGGGGGLWLDHDEDVKPSEERLREAVEDTAAGDRIDAFVVACPMCVTMFEDGRKTGGFEDDLAVVDLTELIVESMGMEEQAGLA